MDEPAPTTDAERELAARRRELEREFDDKQRDLKAQHKRQADKLQQDRVEWEAHRREHQKQLSDREEKVRRLEDNHKRDLAALKEAQRQLDAARAELGEARVKRAEVAQAQAGESESKDRLKATRTLLAGLSFVAIAGSAASLLGAVLGDRPTAYVAGGLTLLLALGIEVRRRRL